MVNKTYKFNKPIRVAVNHVETLAELDLYFEELIASCDIRGGLMSDRVSTSRLFSSGKNKRLEVDEQQLKQLAALEQRTQRNRLRSEHSVIL